MTQEKFQRNVKNKLEGICKEINVKMVDSNGEDGSSNTWSPTNGKNRKRSRRKCAPSKQHVSKIVDSNNNADSSPSNYTAEVIDIEVECVKAKAQPSINIHNSNKRKKTSLDQLLSRVVAKKQKKLQIESENVTHDSQDGETKYDKAQGGDFEDEKITRSTSPKPEYQKQRTIHHTNSIKFGSPVTSDIDASGPGWFQRSSSPPFKKQSEPYTPYNKRSKSPFSHSIHDFSERSTSPPIKYHSEHRRFKRSVPQPSRFQEYTRYENSRQALSQHGERNKKFISPNSKHRYYRETRRSNSPGLRHEEYTHSKYRHFDERSKSPSHEYVENTASTTVLRPKARRASTASLTTKYFYPTASTSYTPTPPPQSRVGTPSPQSRVGSVWSSATTSTTLPEPSTLTTEQTTTSSKGRSSKFFPPNKRQVTTNQRYAKLNNTQLQRRLVANARERSRVHALSNAFDALRTTIPSYSTDQKLSKLTILRVAINYIDALTQLLAPKTPETQKRFEECVEECTSVLQQEYGKSKVK